jgi:hypothetical protein
MHTVLTQPAAGETAHGRRRRCWPLAVAGLALLVASIVMMAVGAQPSRAQTAHPHLAPARLAPLRLPELSRRFITGDIGTVSPVRAVAVEDAYIAHSSIGSSGTAADICWIGRHRAT